MRFEQYAVNTHGTHVCAGAKLCGSHIAFHCQRHFWLGFFQTPSGSWELEIFCHQDRIHDVGLCLVVLEQVGRLLHSIGIVVVDGEAVDLSQY